MLLQSVLPKLERIKVFLLSQYGQETFCNSLKQIFPQEKLTCTWQAHPTESPPGLAPDHAEIVVSELNQTISTGKARLRAGKLTQCLAALAGTGSC